MEEIGNNKNESFSNELLDVSDDQIDELREDCQLEEDAESHEGWFRDRFSHCVERPVVAVLLGPGPPIPYGIVRFNMAVLGFAENNDRKVHYVGIIDDIVVEHATEPPGVWEITQDFFPKTSTENLNTPVTSTRAASLIEWDLDPEWSLTWESPGDEHLHPDDLQIVNTLIQMDLRIDSPTADWGWSEDNSVYSNVRFDHAGQTVGTHKGTVFRDARVEYSLSLTDPEVRETAQHIRDAQQRPWLTFPSWVGKTTPDETEPVHRLTDSTLVDRNRARAVATCGQVWGDYDGDELNCDEYPFASTHEGAANSNDRYSARIIDADDNQEAGRRLFATYSESRLLDGDPFYVVIKP